MTLLLLGLVMQTGANTLVDLFERDEAFARAVIERDHEAFSEIIHPDAIFLGGSRLEGRHDVVEGWEAFMQPEGPTLHWEPRQGRFSKTRDMGYTLGPYELTQNVDGQLRVVNGMYLTVWTRSPDGPWLARADGPLVNPPEGATWSVDGENALVWVIAGKPIASEKLILDASGEFAFAVGRYDRDGRTRDYLCVLRRQDDSWELLQAAFP